MIGLLELRRLVRYKGHTPGWTDPLGAVVTHGGKTWVSLTPFNVTLLHNVPTSDTLGR